MCSLDTQGQVLAWLGNTSETSLSVHYFVVGGGYFSNIFEITF